MVSSKLVKYANLRPAGRFAISPKLNSITKPLKKPPTKLVLPHHQSLSVAKRYEQTTPSSTISPHITLVTPPTPAMHASLSPIVYRHDVDPYNNHEPPISSHFGKYMSTDGGTKVHSNPGCKIRHTLTKNKHHKEPRSYTEMNSACSRHVCLV